MDGSIVSNRIAIQPSVVPTIDDETKAELEIDEIDTSPFSMFAVFDGHGGPACAEVWFQARRGCNEWSSLQVGAFMEGP